MKTFKSKTINATIPFIETEYDEKIILEIMRSVLKVEKLWISVKEGVSRS